MRLLLIDNYDSFTFNLYHGLSGFFSRIIVRRNDSEDMPGPEEFDAIVFSPGPGLPSEAGRCKELISSYLNSKPLLGICLGHQAIVECCGGSLVNLERVIHGKARTTLVCDPADPVYNDTAPAFEAGRYHSWVADPDNLPESLKVTATDESGQIMSLKHKTLPVWGMQFHPESVLTPDGGRLLQNWAREVQRIIRERDEN